MTENVVVVVVVVVAEFVAEFVAVAVAVAEFVVRPPFELSRARGTLRRNNRCETLSS